MPRYFFDIHDGVDIRDEVGRQIESPGDIRREAIKVISGLLAAEAEDSDGHTLVLTVRDDQGETICVIRTVCQVSERAPHAFDLAS